MRSPPVKEGPNPLHWGSDCLVRAIDVSWQFIRYPFWKVALMLRVPCPRTLSKCRHVCFWRRERNLIPSSLTESTQFISEDHF